MQNELTDVIDFRLEVTFGKTTCLVKNGTEMTEMPLVVITQLVQLRAPTHHIQMASQGTKVVVQKQHDSYHRQLPTTVQ